LDAASLADVLPALRPGADAERHLSRGGALDLAWSLGIVGGNPARPAGALEWARRATEREREIKAQLARAGDEDDPDAPGIARRAWELERQLRDLGLIRPALEALVGVARYVVDGASIADVWPALRDFLARWLLQPGAGARVQVLLDAALGPLVTDAACAAVAGAEALRMIEETLVSLRVPVGRFGEPAVYVGTVREAVGLGFGAVRVVGLGEGHLPAPPHEDPVLPDALRRRIESGHGVLLPTAADRALGALHALDGAVRGAARRVALSAPRVDVDRSQREPSSVMLEAAAALARPDAVTGASGAVVPDTRALHRDAFLPARRAALAFRYATPLAEAAWQDAVAAKRAGPPPHWRESVATDLPRIAALLVLGAAQPMDGWLAAAADAVPMQGLDAALPVSPTALETLLGCPHRFLLERVIGFHEPSGPPALREIGQAAYGGLFHLVAEQFYRRYGEAFCRGEGTLAEWQARLDPVVNSAFETFVQQYPLIGETVREHERERLRQDARELLESDWQAVGSRRFVDVERVFGRPTPVALTLEGRTLHVRGRIDRLDVVDGIVVLRDLKTGRPYPRLGKATGPDPGLDVQLGLYGLVVKVMARDWSLPARIAAAYAYFGRRGSDERDFRNDFETVLEPATRQWLALTADLLAERAFPRTPNADDCTYCAFQPVCGDGVYARAAALLTTAAGAPARFGALKGLGGVDGQENGG
jgi:RecB family exonuclease